MQPRQHTEEQLEIYKAIENVSLKASDGIKKLMEQVQKTLDILLHTYYEKNEQVAEARLTAAEILNSTPTLPSMDRETENAINALREMHQDLAEANKENMNIEVLLQSLHAEPIDKPEVLKAYVEASNQVLNKWSELNEEYRLLSKEEAKQSLFLSDPKLMRDPEQAKAILAKFDEKVKPLLEKTSELKENARQTYKEAKEVINTVQTQFKLGK